MENLKFNKNCKYLKGNHYRILNYFLGWMFGRKPPKSKVIDGKKYYWFSLQKIADDCMMSYYQVKTALYRLENKDKSIDYDGNPFVYAEMVYSRKETNKLYVRLDYSRVAEILEDDEVNGKIIQKMKQETVEVLVMPSLFDVEDKKYSEDAEKIVCDLINRNSDVFRTRIGKTETFKRCCGVVQDIYNGNFTNPHLYNINSKIDTNQFNFDGWKEKIESVEGDWNKIKNMIEKAVKNYRMMFEAQNMPSNKKYLPKNLDKWFYDEFNTKGYPSYFVFSLRKPKAQAVQYGDNYADEIFERLPVKVQDIGNELVDMTGNEYVLWKNLKGMYDWCCEVYTDDLLGKNMGYWADSAVDIMVKFLKYCGERKITVNEYVFDVKKSFKRNMPFCWFITEAIHTYGLNEKILRCA